MKVFAFLLFTIFNFCSFAHSGKTIAGDSTDNHFTLYIFSGTDWCANCLRLDKKVLKDTAFINAMSANNIKIEIIDFPQRKKLPPDVVKYNASIADKFKFEGVYPTLVIYSVESQKSETIHYTDENGTVFSAIILKELTNLHE